MVATPHYIPLSCGSKCLVVAVLALNIPPGQNRLLQGFSDAKEIQDLGELGRPQAQRRLFQGLGYEGLGRP